MQLKNIPQLNQIFQSNNFRYIIQQKPSEYQNDEYKVWVLKETGNRYWQYIHYADNIEEALNMMEESEKQSLTFIRGCHNVRIFEPNPVLENYDIIINWNNEKRFIVKESSGYVLLDKNNTRCDLCVLDIKWDGNSFYDSFMPEYKYQYTGKKAKVETKTITTVDMGD